jgi:K(+)-stimulated pyrophosphate-energized sodium pump
LHKNLLIEAQQSGEREVRLLRPGGGKGAALADASGYDLAAAWHLHPLNPGFLASAACGAAFALWYVASLLSELARAADRVEAGLERNPTWTERSVAAAGANAAARGFPMLIGAPILATLAAMAVFGAAGSCGFTLGVLAVGAPLSLAMMRSGQAWASFLRSVKNGAHGGEGSVAHQFAVLGDRLGVPLAEFVAPTVLRMVLMTALIGVALSGLAIRHAAF